MLLSADGAHERLTRNDHPDALPGLPPDRPLCRRTMDQARGGRYRPGVILSPCGCPEGEDLILPGATRLSSGFSCPSLPPAVGAAALPAPEREPPAQAFLLWAAPSH